MSSDLNYQRTVLYQTDYFEVVSIKWLQGQISAMHDHGSSHCMVLVEEGFFENTVDLGFKTEKHMFEKGQVINTPIGAVHRMVCQSATGKTLHVYTPKIKKYSDEKKFSFSENLNLKKDLNLSHETSIHEMHDLLIKIRENSISTHSPYFMNQLFSGVLPQMLMAEELIAQTKTTLATYEASPLFSSIEIEVIESLCKVFGWDAEKRDGISVPGGSAANFMALNCARQKMFPEMKKNGIGGKKLSIFVSSEAHYSFKKACVALGLGSDALIQVPIDDDGCMNVVELEKLIVENKNNGGTPLLVCATSGTTVLGAFDPIDKISNICKKHDLWLHVDGAWGGPAVFSDSLKKLVQGIHLADSVTFDAHKLFGASLTCSFLLTQHKGLLLEANDVSGGDYLFHPTEADCIDRGKMSWQCGRKAEVISFWTIWKSLGTKGLGAFVDRLLDIQQQTIKYIQSEPRLKLVSQPEYLNICVRILPPHDKSEINDWSKTVRETLKNKNLAMVNYSHNQEGPFLRLILAHPYLKFEHVQQILKWSLDVK